ncbi:MAG: hypothetical protein C4527_15280 [Candidatus Omnitrophota bacterium]|jgi:hypothetical protein|nr:MAG: hypothetical protein C4527_15280 [Candidatus Omnitrophota bacterium]
MKQNMVLKLMMVFLLLTAWIVPPSHAFTYWECLNQKLKWDSNTVRMRASSVSFPIGQTQTNALASVIANLNLNPSKFDFNLTYNDDHLRRGNGENETWFSSDPSALNGAPAITWYWYDCVDYWIFGTDVEMNEADVVFDVNRTWTFGTNKYAMWNYGGGARPFRTTAIHELGHALALAHTATSYNIMGEDWTHIHANGDSGNAYFGEDASNGAVFLYGADSTAREDLSVTHWRWTGHSGEYSTHSRTRIFNNTGSELAKVAGETEPRYYVDNGQTIQVEFTYENNGTNSHTVNIQFYLSTNDYISTMDRLLQTQGVTLGRNDVWTTTHTVTLPNDLTPNQDYYIGVIVDSSDSVSEVFEYNNATYIGLRTRNWPTPTPTRTATPTPTNTPFIFIPMTPFPYFTFVPILTPTPTLGIIFPIETLIPFITPIFPVSTPTLSVPLTPTPTPTPRQTLLPASPTPTSRIPSLSRRLFIYDNPDDQSGDLTGQTDFDSVDNRNLTIAWDAEPGDATDWHIYVQSGFGGMLFLGRTGSGNVTRFDWNKNTKTVAPDFSNGPDFNSVYKFRVIRIDGSRGANDVLEMQTPVGFNVEGGKPVPLIRPAMPDLYPRQVLVCDDIFGVKNIAPPVRLGEGYDVDDPSWNALQIVWNFDVDPRTVLDYHVFVSVDGGNFVFLGQTQSGFINYFWWTPLQLFKTDRAFTAGPQDGHTYQFLVILLPLSGNRMTLKTGYVAYSIAAEE